mmetsp:Transcript_22309/g.76353  ORF Transcript_22309/g.76353 Transcript_22309/m.76353 type:complete len:223 (+) Transcript_22309:812-1480(+)
MLRQHRAIDAVLCIGRHSTDHVRGVDVLDGKWLLDLLEVSQDLVAHPDTDVLVVARAFARIAQGVGAAVGDDDDCVALGSHELLNISQKLVQVHMHLGDDTEVNDTRRHDCIQSDKATLFTEQLHEADAVGIARRFHISGFDGLFRLADRGVETEGLVHDGQVVVDGLRDADDGALVLHARQQPQDVDGTFLAAIASDDEELAHSGLLEVLRTLPGGVVPCR